MISPAANTTIGLWGLFEVRPVVLCSLHTPQGSLWVIWAIGCGGFMPLEPPSVLLQGLGPFCLGTLLARFGLWIATDMATAALSTPRSSLGAQGVRGCSGVQPNPCQAPPEHMKPPYRLGARWQLGCFSFDASMIRRSQKGQIPAMAERRKAI